MEDNGWKAFLTNSLRNAWRDQLFTDLTIVTQDETIQAHKLVLAVSSPYFRVLLNSNFTERHSSLLKLDNIRGDTLRVVLDYVYSGRATLTEENAAEILSLADYLQIHDLKRLCCRFIKAHLAPYACLPIYELAILRQCHDLAHFAFQMAVENCSEVMSQPSFLTLQPSTVMALFRQQILHISSEDELLKALMEWTSYNEERKIWYSSLLNLLNEDLLSPLRKRMYLEEIQENVDQKCIEDSGISNAVACRGMQCRHKREEELLIIFGGESSGRILGSAECFSIGYTSWSCSMPRLKDVKDEDILEGETVIPPMRHPRSHAAIAIKDNIIYVIGGQSSSHFLNSCETFSVLSNEWGTFPELPFLVHGAQATFLQEHLWVVGGRNNTDCCDQNSLLMYDYNKECWCQKASLLDGRVHFGIGTVHGCLYAVGGLSCKIGHSDCALSSCEKYDTETDTWIPIASLNRGRAYHGVAVMGDFIYAVGGYDGKKWLNSVERYDPLQDRWVQVSSMIGTRSSFGITISNGRIYCIGGFSGESVLNTAEKYNTRTDMWHCVQSTRLRRYGLVATTIKLPSEKLISEKYGPHANQIAPS